MARKTSALDDTTEADVISDNAEVVPKSVIPASAPSERAADAEPSPSASSRAAPAFDLAKFLDFTRSREGAATFLAIGSILLALTGGAYSLGKDFGAKELEVYKAAQKIDFDGLSKAANAAASDLRTATSQFSELIKAGAEVKDLREKLDAATAAKTALLEEKNLSVQQLAALTAEYKDLGERYTAVAAPESTYTIEVGKTALSANGNLLIGVVELGPYYANLNLNGQQKKSAVGDIIPASVAGPPKTDCQVAVASITAASATVIAKCKSTPLPTCTAPSPAQIKPEFPKVLTPLGIVRF
jgi:hypothetical protein